MTPLEEIKLVRIKKMSEMVKRGLDPFPQTTKRDYSISMALRNFSSLAKKSKEIILAGRLRALRSHGQIIFLDINDGSGKIQAVLKKDGVGEKSFKLFQDIFDIGDFIELRGILFKTKRGEKTLEINDYKMLTKSLRPLPEKWHGLKDIEVRYRKRYLDLIFNPTVKLRFKLRSKIIRWLRKFLEKRGFIEVETPILQTIYGGAKAKPFKTHLNALNIDLYLRISPELYLKRLLVGGFEKVYEIGKEFRNEGVDKFHNPEFTGLEFYWAYADYKDLMKFTEELFQGLVKTIFKKTEISYQGKKINFQSPWPRVEFSQLLKKYTNIIFEEINRESLRKEAEKLGLKVEKNAPKTEIADEIYKKICRDKIINPTFIIHYPLGTQPLAKALKKSPNKLANFQLVVGGVELVNAFSELNNPQEQERRFKEQEKFYRAGLAEAQRMDKDFLEALEYGMPPAAGFGLGIDRLVAILTNSHSLREVILFPAMKLQEK